MSSSKQYNLPPSIVIPLTAVTSGNQSSKITDIFNKDNLSYHFTYTGTLAGTLTVQVSNNWNPDFQTGSFIPLPVTPTQTVTSGGGDNFIDFSTNAKWCQLVFVYGSGSGNISCILVGKAV